MMTQTSDRKIQIPEHRALSALLCEKATMWLAHKDTGVPRNDKLHLTTKLYVQHSLKDLRIGKRETEGPTSNPSTVWPSGGFSTPATFNKMSIGRFSLITSSAKFLTLLRVAIPEKA